MASRIAQRRPGGFTLIELMIVVAIIGLLAAIAIPNFIKFQARSKTGEAKANLKSLFTTEKAYFAEKETYATTLDTLGFAPERGNRYAYEAFDPPVIHQTRDVSLTGTQANYDCIDIDSFKNVGLTGAPAHPAASGTATYTAEAGETQLTTTPSIIYGQRGGFSVQAVGNIDTETAGLDTWFIASQGATVSASACSLADNVPEGNPGHLYDDVSCDLP